MSEVKGERTCRVVASLSLSPPAQGVRPLLSVEDITGTIAVSTCGYLIQCAFLQVDLSSGATRTRLQVQSISRLPSRAVLLQWVRGNSAEAAALLLVVAADGTSWLMNVLGNSKPLPHPAKRMRHEQAAEFKGDRPGRLKVMMVGPEQRLPMLIDVGVEVAHATEGGLLVCCNGRPPKLMPWAAARGIDDLPVEQSAEESTAFTLNSVWPVRAFDVTNSVWTRAVEGEVPGQAAVRCATYSLQPALFHATVGGTQPATLYVDERGTLRSISRAPEVCEAAPATLHEHMGLLCSSCSIRAVLF